MCVPDHAPVLTCIAEDVAESVSAAVSVSPMCLSSALSTSLHMSLMVATTACPSRSSAEEATFSNGKGQAEIAAEMRCRT